MPDRQKDFEIPKRRVDDLPICRADEGREGKQREEPERRSPDTAP
jgi:hypothetical protein